MSPIPSIAWLSAGLVLLAGCGPSARETASPSSSRPTNSTPDPLRIVLIPHPGNSKLDDEIRRAQEEVPASKTLVASLEHLGWLYVDKARATFDPGFYKMAEQCALALDARAPGCKEGLLLRGHVLQNLHRFHEAEPIARSLTASRGFPFDFGLLGDVLMEQGKLDESISAYQRMADLRPDSQALIRIAHVRWLKGDIEGALEAARSAVRAASPKAAESFAWMQTRLATYEFEAGEADAARADCSSALAVQTNYPPALLLLGRMFLATANSDATTNALVPLRLAATLNPLPNYQWPLADALRVAKQIGDADVVERQLLKTGAAEDPRTFSLFLSTRKLRPELALALATQELTQRADVYTHDAMAWALAANQRWEEAGAESNLARAEGTLDGRILFHAAVIAAHRARTAEAIECLAKATRFERVLYPSERDQLNGLKQSPAMSGIPNGTTAIHPR